MSLRDLVISIALIIGCYWAYTTYFQGQQGNYQDMQFMENAKAMRKCMEREERLVTLSGNAGIAPKTNNVEAFCAGELNMYFDDGHWHKH